MGELSLDGSLQPIKGALPIAIKARELGFEGMIVPCSNAHEAAVVNNLKVYGVENIKDVIEFFNGNQNYPRHKSIPAKSFTPNKALLNWTLQK